MNVAHELTATLREANTARRHAGVETPRAVYSAYHLKIACQRLARLARLARRQQGIGG